MRSGDRYFGQKLRIPSVPIDCLITFIFVYMMSCCVAQANIRCTLPPGNAPNGPTVKSEEFCRYFKAYRRNGSSIDTRILRTMGLGDSDSYLARRMALVVGVGDYPNLDADANLLESANNDLRNLTKFLIDDQEFDEVIVLSNADATKENIEYFLTSYIKHVANSYSGHTQFLFAYTGHGFPSQNHGESSQLALYGISGFDDYERSLGLGTLAQWLRDLASVNFSSVALINACYGGDIFGISYGGANPDAPGKPGGWALTAGARDELVWSLGTKGTGSIFYDLLIDGIRSGKADPLYGQKIVDKYGQIVRREALVRLGQLNGFLTAEIEGLGNNPKTQQPYSFPNIGVLQNQGGAQGGFFFLTPRVLAQSTPNPDGTRDANAIGEGGAVSSIYRRPDLKVFNDPDDYPIQGTRLTNIEAKVDWSEAKRSGLEFAYLRATDFNGKFDTSFNVNWLAASAAGIARGAYHTFDPCMPVASQLELLKKVVPQSADALPIAIDVTFHSNPLYAHAGFACAIVTPEELEDTVLELSKSIADYYRKLPVIIGDRWAFENILDDRFRTFPIWLHEIQDGRPSVNLPGSNPWTFWQVGDQKSSSLGMSERTVFFGNAAQFESYSFGTRNEALWAAGVIDK
ncbi:hypothetical protein CO650_31880 [Rhizobium phaseoli]|nr:hypothetical protein CO650_31880 [Rhizobium phaseoli]